MPESSCAAAWVPEWTQSRRVGGYLVGTLCNTDCLLLVTSIYFSAILEYYIVFTFLSKVSPLLLLLGAITSHIWLGSCSWCALRSWYWLGGSVTTLPTSFSWSCRLGKFREGTVSFLRQWLPSVTTNLSLLFLCNITADFWKLDSLKCVQLLLLSIVLLTCIEDLNMRLGS